MKLDFTQQNHNSCSRMFVASSVYLVYHHVKHTNTLNLECCFYKRHLTIHVRYGFREFHYLSISCRDYTLMGKRFRPKAFRHTTTVTTSVTRKSSSSNSDILAQVGYMRVRPIRPKRLSLFRLRRKNCFCVCMYIEYRNNPCVVLFCNQPLYYTLFTIYTLNPTTLNGAKRKRTGGALILIGPISCVEVCARWRHISPISHHIQNGDVADK